jgi:hypothetical protein
MIAAGRPHAAVYIMDPREPPQLDIPAPAAAAAAAAPAAAAAAAAADEEDIEAIAVAAAIAAAVGADAARAAAVNAVVAAAAEFGVDPPAHPAATAAAAAVAAEAAAHAYQARLQEEGNSPYCQVQLLGEPVRPTAETPQQLQAVRIPIMKMERQAVPLGPFGQMIIDQESPPRLVEASPLFLAVPPVMPKTDGRRFPLMFLSRTNLVSFVFVSPRQFACCCCSLVLLVAVVQPAWPHAQYSTLVNAYARVFPGVSEPRLCLFPVAAVPSDTGLVPSRSCAGNGGPPRSRHPVPPGQAPPAVPDGWEAGGSKRGRARAGVCRLAGCPHMLVRLVTTSSQHSHGPSARHAMCGD